ncbi:glycosyltransferase 87 family protein [Alicyclobacillus sendaiensis]|uniref:glycosyltransferase 87 family protein n=1 Tax=Alicyclobacillus sendaiensis TaxID=192387 RepID=UPI00078432BE|nr:glycosyltransferase 87 family protein [Alicyclobacillus sendaiensis]
MSESPLRRLGRWPGWAWFLACALASLAIQLLLAATTRGYVADQAIFLRWAEEVRAWGLSRAYEEGGIDYPPLYLYVLDVYARLASAGHLNVRPGTLWAKLPGVILYAAFMPLIWRLSRGLSEDKRRWAIATYCLNPVLIFDTAVWGQVDVLDATLALVAVWLVARRPLLAGVAFGLGLAAKFETIVVLPVLVGAALFVPNRVRRVAAMALGALMPLALSVLPLAGGGLWPMIRSAYIGTTSEYPYLSMNAMNIWFDLLDASPYISDRSTALLGLSYKDVGLLLLTAACLAALAYLARSRRALPVRLLIAAGFVSFSFFMLATEMHERYVVLAVALMAWLGALDKRWRAVAAAVAFSAFWNLWVVCFGAVNAQQDAWMVYLNLAAYGAMEVIMVREVRRRRTVRPAPEAIE